MKLKLSEHLDQCKIDPNGCWLWTGSVDRNGYGRMGSGWAHRVVYTHFKGKIPKGKHLDHLCRTPLCVNPDHLEPVTPRENMLRSDAPSALVMRTNHCRNGHELTEDNVYYRPDGKGKNCKTCINLRVKVYRATENGKLRHREANKRSQQRQQDRIANE